MPRNPSGRFQIMTELPSHPHVCAICGIPAGPVDGKKLEFADFGLSFEFYGAFYLCERCVLDLADNFECMSPDNSRLLIAMAEELKKELKQAEEKIKDLENALGNSLIAGLNVVVDSSGNILSSNVSTTNSVNK